LRLDAGGTPLHFAAGVGNSKDVAEVLIDKGADVNAKSKDDFTPLHNAAGRGHKDIAEVLIAKGADVNSRSKGGFFKKGKTPLGLADAAEHKEVVELLKLHGAEK
jgi:cytohesin